MRNFFVLVWLNQINVFSAKLRSNPSVSRPYYSVLTLLAIMSHESQVLHTAAGKAVQSLMKSKQASNHDCQRCNLIYGTVNLCITTPSMKILANDPCIVIEESTPDEIPAQMRYQYVAIRDYSGSNFIHRYSQYQVTLRRFLRTIINDLKTGKQLKPMFYYPPVISE